MSSNYLEQIDGKILRLVELIILIGGIIWMVAFLRADVNTNKNWNERQDAEIQGHSERARRTYLRKDVAEQQYINIMNKLEQIEKKIDE